MKSTPGGGVCVSAWHSREILLRPPPPPWSAWLRSQLHFRIWFGAGAAPGRQQLGVQVVGSLPPVQGTWAQPSCYGTWGASQWVKDLPLSVCLPACLPVCLSPCRDLNGALPYGLQASQAANVPALLLQLLEVSSCLTPGLARPRPHLPGVNTELISMLCLIPLCRCTN